MNGGLEFQHEKQITIVMLIIRITIITWLVVWNMNGWIMTFHSVGTVIIPTDELHDFSEGWRKTTNQSTSLSLWGETNQRFLMSFGTFWHYINKSCNNYPI